MNAKAILVGRPLRLPHVSTLAGVLLSLLGVAACASPARPVVPPMSVAQHELLAADLDKSAQATEKKYDPYADQSSMCLSSAIHATGRPCWSSVKNPTRSYLAHADDHRRLAAAHRDVAQSLRDAEMRACASVPADDRDESPFDHREDILRIEPLLSASSAVAWTEGVVVTFRDVPGISVDWLQNVMDCQIARNAALGNDVPELQRCLLVPRGVRAKVTKARDGFAVVIRASDEDTANELLRRGEAIMATSTR